MYTIGGATMFSPNVTLAILLSLAMVRTEVVVVNIDEVDDDVMYEDKDFNAADDEDVGITAEDENDIRPTTRGDRRVAAIRRFMVVSID
mmetsp:Transcript_24880/g.59067  ORF Transcript_24880/g.59067 Transcript_24880/m.59067 type:complete len:89 (-) Transcript_24880:107-373(-)